jgi:hypothetical protein
MKTIHLNEFVREFAENKDIARDIREKEILPALKKGEKITLDFDGLTGATQSFVHAMISEPFRIYGSEVLDNIFFKNCNETIQKIVTIVAEYMQESV